MLAEDDLEHPIPAERRATFHRIADAFVEGDFTLWDHPFVAFPRSIRRQRNPLPAISGPMATAWSACIRRRGSDLSTGGRMAIGCCSSTGRRQANRSGT